MLSWEQGTVVALREGWEGVARVRVRTAEGEELPALAYEELTGAPVLGETVLLNANALRRGLGTGGDAFVVARPQALESAEQPAGHMVKARYTPMQTLVDAVDDPSGEHHAVLAEADSLDGLPVVVCDLHSALPAVVAGIRSARPGARIVHVHTDGAALPSAFSRTAAQLREEGLVAATISAGQSFGGDLEAVTVHSALLAARHVLAADVAIVAQGPGNLGTGTPWGFSGIQLAEAVHAVHVLGGAPIVAMRVSQADPRPRHQGLSHHASTLLGAGVLAPVRCAVPDDPQRTAVAEIHALVAEQLYTAVLKRAAARGVQHELVEVPAAGLMEALEQLPVALRTMGRGLHEDPAAFLYPALAGVLAAAGPLREGETGDGRSDAPTA